MWQAKSNPRLLQSKTHEALYFFQDKKTAKFVHATLKSTDVDALLWESSSPKDLVEQNRVIIATDLASR